MFTFLPKEWDFVLGKSTHTQHAFTQGQCCVSAILDPLLQFWTSEWCRGEPKWRWVFSCLSVNTLGVGCWCVGRLLMGVMGGREGRRGRWGVRGVGGGWGGGC